MAVQVTIIGAADRKLEELVRSSGLRPTVASAVDLLGLTHPAAVQPEVVVLDLRGCGHVPAALAVLKRQHPATCVLLVASTLEPGLMLDAMRAGINECVAEPLTPVNVGDALARVLTHRHALMAGRVFAFVGAKGGVGTTTLAVNVATVLAKTGPALLIDMHPAYGDAAVLLGAEPRFSIVDALENTHRLDDSFFSGLAVRTEAGPMLLASSDHGPTRPIDVHRVRLLLDFTARQYRYIVLDVPRSNGSMLDALEGAAVTVIVTSQELASVRGASRVADMLRRRYGREKVSVVISRFDKNAEIGAGDVEQAVHGDVRFTFPNDYRVAQRAVNAGRPLALDSSTRLAASVISFAGYLAGRSQPDTTPHDRPIGGLMARLASLRWNTSS